MVRRVSLHFSISQLGSAIDGCRMLVDAVGADALSGSDRPRNGIEAVGAMLSIVGVHIDNLLRVTRGEADPRIVGTSGNGAPDEPLPDCFDLALPVWEARKAFEHAMTHGGATVEVSAKPKRRRSRR